MRKERNRRLPEYYNSLQVTRDHLARGEERIRLQTDHARNLEEPCIRSTAAAELKAFRAHFAGLLKKVVEWRERVKRTQQTE